MTIGLLLCSLSTTHGMNCSNCEEYWERQQIKSPEKLRTLLVQLADAVKGGILLPLAPAENEIALGLAPFETVKSEGPWPDIVSFRFRCNSCNREFKLSCETYHGSGGEWSGCRQE